MANPAKNVVLNTADNTITVDGVVLPVALATGQFVNLQQTENQNILNLGIVLDPQHSIETTNISAEEASK